MLILNLFNSSSFSAGERRNHVAGHNVAHFQNEAFSPDDMNQVLKLSCISPCLQVGEHFPQSVCVRHIRILGVFLRLRTLRRREALTVPALITYSKIKRYIIIKKTSRKPKTINDPHISGFEKLLGITLVGIFSLRLT